MRAGGGSERRNGPSRHRVVVPVVLAGLGLLLGAQRLMTTPPPTANDLVAGDKKVANMATDDEIARAEAELQAAQQELQGKLTRSIPGGVKLASPETGMELKRLREDVEAKQRRLDELRR